MLSPGFPRVLWSLSTLLFWSLVETMSRGTAAQASSMATSTLQL